MRKMKTFVAVLMAVFVLGGEGLRFYRIFLSINFS